MENQPHFNKTLVYTKIIYTKCEALQEFDWRKEENTVQCNSTVNLLLISYFLNSLNLWSILQFDLELRHKKVKNKFVVQVIDELKNYQLILFCFIKD